VCTEPLHSNGRYTSIFALLSRCLEMLCHPRYSIIEATENLRETCNYTVTSSASESVLNEITTVELVLSLIMRYEVLGIFNRMCSFGRKNVETNLHGTVTYDAVITILCLARGALFRAQFHSALNGARIHAISCEFKGKRTSHTHTHTHTNIYYSLKY
jgi:hypothetical protein